MAKKIFSFVLVVTLSLTLLPATGMAQCAPTKGQRAKGALAWGGVGAVIGGLIGHGKGAAIGAAVGASVGGFGARNTRCIERFREQQLNDPRTRVAPANAPTPAVSDGPRILLRNVRGADRQKIQAVAAAIVAEQGYAMLDPEMARAKGLAARYYLDLVVADVSGSSGSGGGSIYAGRVFANGNGAAGKRTYQVALAMIDAWSGIEDPSRSPNVNIQISTYRNGNGYAAFPHVDGWGSHVFYANDPQTAAAEAALAFFFR